MWRLLITLAQALKEGGAHDGEADGGVEKDSAEAAASSGGTNLPGDGLRIGGAGKAPSRRAPGRRARRNGNVPWDVFSGAADAARGNGRTAAAGCAARRPR